MHVEILLDLAGERAQTNEAVLEASYRTALRPEEYKSLIQWDRIAPYHVWLKRGGFSWRNNVR
jgi:hypothetical protein